MSDTIRISPEVDVFVQAVHAHFADLDPDEREELLGGLAADITDLVDEHGPGALGDPGAYAAELRAAAGLAVTRSRRGHILPASPKVDAVLDNMRAEWERLATALPGDAWGFLQSVRPFWWLVRAWVAVQLIDLAWGNGGYNAGLDVIPSLRWLGFPLLVAASVISVQIGRGKLWSAPRRGMRRVALLLLNLFALALVPAVVDNLVTTAKVHSWYGGYLTGSAPQEPGLSLNGRPVRNIYPYDAAGKPLVGVQLVDESGRRLGADSWAFEWGSPRTVPWMNGRTEAWNVFPLSEQPTRARNGRPTGDPSQPPAPYAVLPPVTLTGVTPSDLVVPEPVTRGREDRSGPTGGDRSP
ncbi:hypothetical protein [Nocardioides sp.]|uniref:hypothetical protein n=1 Tax=Nocardioides sp. TaxID=35761 RepID=UPI002D197C94|nr:hypothetical protein [Nocardioides sp.]HXH77921.1 hypothetical protein [Nocardioides sp.]